MSSDVEWPRNLGFPDFSVTPDWRTGPTGSKKVSYWLCGDAGDETRSLAKHVQQIIEEGGAEALDESSFSTLATKLSELDLAGQVCSAVYDSTGDAWYPLQRCSMHPAPPSGPYYLVIDLDSASGPQPETMEFESRELAEEALLAIQTSVEFAVTVTNGRDALMRIRRDVIVGARIATERPLQS